MTTTAKDLQKVITKVLSGEGFKKHKSRNDWYFSNNEVTQVVNLQRSQWGDQYYINLGVLIRPLTDLPFPKEYQCHIRARLSDLVKDGKRLERALDLEDGSLTPEQRLAEVEQSLRDYGLPWLQSLKSLDGMREVLRKGETYAVFTAAAKDFLRGAQR